MKEKKKLICFDLDNTLILSDRCHVSAYQWAFLRMGLPAVPPRELTKRFGMPGGLVVREIFPHLSDGEVATIRRYHDAFVVKRGWRMVRPIVGVSKLLTALRKAYRIALVTNSRASIVAALLRGGKLDRRFFDVTVSSGNHVHPKPAADEILRAEHLLRLNASFMVGDSIYDMQASRRARVRGIGVLSGHSSVHQLYAAGAWKVTHDVLALRSLLALRSILLQKRNAIL